MLDSMENDSELVLERIMEDGTFDELRKKIVERVKQDVCAPGHPLLLYPSSTSTPMFKVYLNYAGRIERLH